MSEFDGVCKVSKLDQRLKDFIGLCSELECCITELTRERDSPRSNEEYYLFKKELVRIKNEAILESYKRKCLEWKF